MYSLDINFLKDRPDYRPDTGTPNSPTTVALPAGSKLPIYIGVGVGLLLVALVGGAGLFLQQQTANLQAENSKLEGELGRLKGLDAQLQQINDQINQETEEAKALASVFNQIKPWSATLQDFRVLIPAGTQVRTIQQTQITAAPASPSPSPSPNGAPSPDPNEAQAQAVPTVTSQLNISGTAASFREVNDFLLTLQRSAFLNARETRLVNAAAVENPIPVEVRENQGNNQTEGTINVALPRVVEYTIQTQLSAVPASELIRELERKGAVGLVTRIRTLQEKGVIQP